MEPFVTILTHDLQDAELRNEYITQNCLSRLTLLLLKLVKTQIVEMGFNGTKIYGEKI
jgi:hypothetical protein